MVNAANLDQVAEAGLTQVCLAFVVFCLFVCFIESCLFSARDVEFFVSFDRHFLSDSCDQSVSLRCLCQRRC